MVPPCPDRMSGPCESRDNMQMGCIPVREVERSGDCRSGGCQNQYVRVSVSSFAGRVRACMPASNCCVATSVQSRRRSSRERAAQPKPSIAREFKVSGCVALCESKRDCAPSPIRAPVLWGDGRRAGEKALNLIHPESRLLTPLPRRPETADVRAVGDSSAAGGRRAAGGGPPPREPDTLEGAPAHAPTHTHTHAHTHNLTPR
eukprot:353991-Chlamydomonas_euryale.AAC.7